MLAKAYEFATFIWPNLNSNDPYQDTDDDETETTEESPCGRWLKRREEIKYRQVHKKILERVQAQYKVID